MDNVATISLELSQLINKTKERLLELNYSKKYLTDISLIHKKLQIYADKNNIKVFSMDLASKFANDIYDLNIYGEIPRRNNVARALQFLADIQLHGVFSRRKKIIYKWPVQFSELFEEFYLLKKPTISDNSLKTYKFYLQNIAEYFESKDLKNISQVTSETINSFILSKTQYCNKTLTRNINILSNLMQYAYEKGYHTENLALTCPKIRIIKDPRIPSTFTDEEVTNLLNVVDRGNPLGKRDYAILLLVAKTGLRTGDICKLTFDNLHWDTNTIEITQNKTGQPLCLPLLEDVGLAIIDYVKNARPITESNCVFVGHRAPFDSFKGRMNLIVKKYMSRAKIPGVKTRRPGLHMLRHSLASSMLENNTPLPVISGVLGHLSSESTKGYLKIDITQLSNCSLEVPYENS